MRDLSTVDLSTALDLSTASDLSTALDLSTAVDLSTARVVYHGVKRSPMDLRITDHAGCCHIPQYSKSLTVSMEDLGN